MKFLIAFATLLAVASAVYITPVAHPAYAPYAAAPIYTHGPVYHHLYKRAIVVSPYAYNPGYYGTHAYSAPLYTAPAGYHALYKREAEALPEAAEPENVEQQS